METTENVPPGQVQRPTLVVRALGVLLSLAFSGTSLLAVFMEYAPERSTRFGMAGPLFGEMAVSFGITTAIFGLMPLALCARTPKGAGIFAGGCAVLALAHLFWSLSR